MMEPTYQCQRCGLSGFDPIPSNHACDEKCPGCGGPHEYDGARVYLCDPCWGKRALDQELTEALRHVFLALEHCADGPARTRLIEAGQMLRVSLQELERAR